ncbi:DUF3325 domain-containing protein [Myxococcus sp. SDU36]|uniref:DUF3325 domain-containing protein n=1 Tax=Myxococcus sp. SDU36 TaxID=2831967 RepID=UPI002543E55C|nr:DUF3325 domain-containing protein [Myxococcus sp. SDU36]WIG94867.1 DUF3325 domain-containing protein [Myxococcus sp. SDU36]
MMALTTLALAFLSFVAFATGMNRHHEQLRKTRPSPRVRQVSRALAWGLLALSLIPCVMAYGASIGLTWWTGLLTAAAVSVVLLFTYRPTAIPVVSAVVAVLVPVSALL